MIAAAPIPAAEQEAALLVQHIAQHQRTLGLSDVAFVKRYPALGSARTWRTRLLAGAWGEVRVEGWLAALRGLLDGIEAEPPPPAPRPVALDPVDRALARVAMWIEQAEAEAAEGDFAGAAVCLSCARSSLGRAEMHAKGGRS